VSREDGLLTSDEAQKRLGVGPGMFWVLARRHGIPQFRGSAGKRRVGSLFRPEDVDRLRAPIGRILQSRRRT
jgi:hypothetical protein